MHLEAVLTAAILVFAVSAQPAGARPADATWGRPPELRSRSLAGALPGTFVGTLPCADCAGIRYQVELFGDSVFYLRTTYLGRLRELVSDELGTWSLSADGLTLSLDHGGNVPLRFRVLDADRIEKLDQGGRPIVSTLNYLLRRNPEAENLEPSFQLEGMYRYFADTWTFRECRTGRFFPIVGPAAIDVERAFMEQRGGQEWLRVTLHGTIRELPPMEGPGTRPHLVVESFVASSPGEDCERIGDGSRSDR